MNKHIFIFLLCLLVTGCANTKVFMGSYDSVSITVSRERAEIVAENLPYETHMVNGKLERKIIGSSIFISDDEVNNKTPEYANVKGKLHVNIISSDENQRRALSVGFNNNGVIIEKSFHKPANSKIISKVTIHPKRKYHDNLAGEYHLITFQTMGGLTGGSYRILVKDPLSFTFPSTDTEAKTMYIRHYGNIKNGKYVVNDIKTVLPLNLTLKVLSKTISTMKKPIKIIFTVN
ncbi:MAG: hypothetical protein ACE5KZ_12535 [Candidatus Scalinduaceae bacterium]